MFQYRCKKCGTTVKGKYRETPNRGSHTTASCPCGNKGHSNGHSGEQSGWRYEIPEFEKL